MSNCFSLTINNETCAFIYGETIGEVAERFSCVIEDEDAYQVEIRKVPFEKKGQDC
ncbi:MAG TPA: hypothetical protein VNM69_02235 [Bacillus sp. (in: firmicutes)]|nr:hypothetical protein [Bacillus sp. (in: firmicutes)]